MAFFVGAGVVEVGGIEDEGGKSRMRLHVMHISGYMNEGW